MSLTDLLKQRNSVNGAQAKKFKLPSVFMQKSNETSPIVARPSKLTSLSELANAHKNTSTKLDSEPQKLNFSQNINIPQQLNQSKFVLPKLNSGNGNSGSVSPSSAGESLTPHEISLKKIMDLKRLHISPSNDTESAPSESTIYTSNPNTNTLQQQQQQLSIDLASALNGPNNTDSVIALPKPVVEKIDFKFIDCDISQESIQPLYTQDCCLNISNILEKEFANRTKFTTAFGNILCSKYKHKRQTAIYHGFESKHQIKPFRFDVNIKTSK